MSLVSQVGRKRFRARFALLVIYSLLSIGAITTLYPFALMASTGFKGPTDQNDNVLVPSYFSKFDGVDDKGKPDDKTLYGKYVNDKYGGDAAMIASTRGTTSGDVAKYEEFLRQLPVDYWSAGFKLTGNTPTSRLVKLYRDWLQQRYPKIDDVNKAYIEEDVGFQTVLPPAELLEKRTWQQPNSRKYAEWRAFKETLPAEFRIPVRETHMYQEYLRAKYLNVFASVPPEIAGKATKFEEIAFRPKSSADEFYTKGIPKRYAQGAAESFWSAFIAKDATTADSSNSGPMPIEAYEHQFAQQHQSEIKSEFMTRNYAYVVQYIALNGGALWNTIIFCFLAIIVQLTINPLAAYALSRYPIRASGKILIFLLATMAFPAEVAMIPSFLLLKQLHLLNTFAALVFPAAASGYMIFLLKGFFDSLPQELFEAGQIDGAKEVTMMTRIALPLSKPVLGYLALLAFMGAYGAFLYAFLVVQDQKMWTLMVWIYQLQSTAPKATIMAALTLAAIPTLLVFLLAQRTIMKGIVLPSER